MQTKFNNALQYCRTMQFTNRCNGQPQVLPNYNVLLHGASMVQLLYLLCAEYEEEYDRYMFDPIEMNVMTKTLLFHDGIEQFTGDILAPAKWKAPTVCDMIEQRVYEDLEATDSLYTLSNIVYTDAIIEEGLTQEELYVFKFLDMAEYALRLLEECACGNVSPKVQEGLRNARRVCKERYNIDDENVKNFLNPLYRYIMENTFAGED